MGGHQSGFRNNEMLNSMDDRRKLGQKMDSRLFKSTNVDEQHLRNDNTGTSNANLA